MADNSSRGELGSCMRILLEQHWEYVNGADGREELHESYGVGEYSDDRWGWTWEDDDDLLKQLPQIAIAEFNTGRAIKESDWYKQIVGFLNDAFPERDGVWINIEGILSQFCQSFLKLRAVLLKRPTK